MLKFAIFKNILVIMPWFKLKENFFISDFLLFSVSII